MIRNWLAVALGAGCLGFLATAALSQEPAKEGGKESPTAQSQGYDLLGKKVDKAPELKAEINDAWKQAPLHTVKVVKGKGADVELDLRAMHDGAYIYILARWADADQSITKGGWTYTKEGWQRLKGDEDRLAFAFNVNVAGFAEKGCASLCHYSEMRTGAEGEKADLWHWKAARGGLHGYCDDQHFAFSDEAGRADDEGGSAYKDNQEKEGKTPLRRWKDDADKNGPFSEDTTVEVAADWKPAEGYTVPSIMLRKPKGSRADIEAVGKHSDGHWVVMFKRKLDTGNADDVKFEPGADTALTAAIFDNTGAKTGSEHKKSGVVRLRLEK